MTSMEAQRGQALAESLVVLGALASLWLGVAWLGRVQDAALQLSHASRQAAFAWAHQGITDTDLAAQAVDDSQASGQHGQTRQGSALLPDRVGLRLDASRVRSGRWPGDPVAGAALARQELQLGDETFWRIQASARTAGQGQTSGRLWDFDRLAVSLQRHTAILRGAGAASGDLAAQTVLGGSGQLWGRYVSVSQAAGQAVDRRLQGVDAAWGRTRPQWDWLGAWSASVPARHIRQWGAP
ncbi:hypothetical protein [Castellaniella sp.]|uniref:hypothetical protein n=1 Tax=Castellaniella sp. TaxID=1955812 RepID=UPI002AFEE534|nr:hypothetical protein [Castellaniella sp.]